MPASGPVPPVPPAVVEMTPAEFKAWAKKAAQGLVDNLNKLPSRSARIEKEMERELTPFEYGQTMYAVNRVLECLLADRVAPGQAPSGVEMDQLREQALMAIAPHILRAVREDDDVELAPGQTRGDSVAQACVSSYMEWLMQRRGLR